MVRPDVDLMHALSDRCAGSPFSFWRRPAWNSGRPGARSRTIKSFRWRRSAGSTHNRRTGGPPHAVRGRDEARQRARGWRAAVRRGGHAPSPSAASRAACRRSRRPSAVARGALDRLGEARRSPGSEPYWAVISLTRCCAPWAGRRPRPPALDRLADADLLHPESRLASELPLQARADPGRGLREPQAAARRCTAARRKSWSDSQSPRRPSHEVIAHHFTQAGLDELAIEWWGKRAMLRRHSRRRSPISARRSPLADKPGRVDAAASTTAEGQRLKASGRTRSGDDGPGFGSDEPPCPLAGSWRRASDSTPITACSSAACCCRRAGFEEVAESF